MPFDPDAYLKTEQPTSGGFDPDAYLGAKKEEKGLLAKAGDYASEKLKDISEGLTTGLDLKRILQKPVETVTTVPGFKRDASKAGQVPASEYAEKAASGAAAGGAIGGGLGLITGPGAIVGGTTGAVTGALGGLTEAWAKDVGYDTDFQTLAGIVGGGFSTDKTLTALTKNKLAHQAIQKAEGFVLDTLPKIGIVRKTGRALDRIFGGEERIAAKDIQAATGAPAQTAGTKLATDPSSQMYQFNQQLQKEANVSKVSDLYEGSKKIYDQALTQATPNEITGVISKAEENLPKSSVNRIKKLFIDAEGNPYSGDVVVNNLKYDNPMFAQLTEKEQQIAKKSMNDFMESKNLGRPEENARKWSEKQFGAMAKDTLPELFKDKSYRVINQQMQNFSKTPEGSTAFLKEMGYSMSKLSPDEVRTMWQNIGPGVNQWIVKDPAKFKKIQNMANQIKDEKSAKRFTSELIRGGYAIREATKEGE